MDQQKTGAFLKCLRKDKGLSQEQLAELFHVSSRTISRWETGSNLPDVDTLLKLADFYDADILDILAGEKKPLYEDRQATDTLKKVASYATRQEKQKQSTAIYIALGVSIALLVFTMLFTGEIKGLLYGIIPEVLCHGILFFAYGAATALLLAYLKSHWWQEKPSTEPERTVAATVLSKAVIPGTHGAGRSKGGYSYTITFLTEDGMELTVFSYETEFGSLKEGSKGFLTYKGKYFVSFQ